MSSDVTHLVQLEKVSLRYGAGAKSTLAIEGIDLKIRRGEFVAVVGPSGCGKSTLMKLVSGLVPVSAGVGAGRGPRGRRAAEVGRHGVPEPATCCPGARRSTTCCCRWRSCEPHRARIGARPQGRICAKARGAARARSGSAASGDKFPWELSGGMQQRTSICRALIHEPELLMLDEPFGALDAFTREELWCAMRDLHAARGVTVMLVTHDLREAVFLADTVYVMSRASGPHRRRARGRAAAAARPGAHLHAGVRRDSCTSCAPHPPSARCVGSVNAIR